MLENQQYFGYLEKWMAELPEVEIGKLCPQPNNSAIICVDLVNGFCNEGPLASPRVKQIIEPIVELFDQANRAGIPHFVLIHDSHEPAAVEFDAFPPHCIRGSREAETVDELQSLLYYSKMIVLEKNSIQSGLNTGLGAWLAEHSNVDTFIVVGDCTDLCVYQLAMHLRLDANARQLKRTIVVPGNCVETYDLPVEVAQEIGAIPHPGNLLHAVFLHHMVLNGIHIIAGVE